MKITAKSKVKIKLDKDLPGGKDLHIQPGAVKISMKGGDGKAKAKAKTKTKK